MLRSIASLAALSIMSVGACSAPGASGPVLSYETAFIMEPVSADRPALGGIDVTSTGGAVRLVSVSSPVAGKIEMHTMEMTDGKMRMRPAEGFDIADGETLTLAKGGNHLMVFDLAPEVKAGGSAELTLTFETEDGRDLAMTAVAEIVALGEAPGQGE